MGILKDMGMREGGDRINEEAAYNIVRAYTLLDTYVSRFLHTYNMSPAKFNILLAVKHIGKEKGVPQQAISKALLVTVSNMSKMIDKLVRDDCVERIAQEGDRRVNLIRITRKGSDLLDAVWPHYKEKIDKIVGSAFSKSETKVLIRTLEKFKNIT